MKTVGELLRRYRIALGKTQGEVARGLDKSIAFWSAIESDKKPCPTALVAEISKIFKLSADQCHELERLAEESKTEHRLNVSQLRPDIQQVTASFARRFKELSEDDVKQIRKILEPDG